MRIRSIMEKLRNDFRREHPDLTDDEVEQLAERTYQLMAAEVMFGNNNDPGHPTSMNYHGLIERTESHRQRNSDR